jgi:fructose-1,6-bisphosphatase/inositol monophosphatase family enzyme
MNHELTREVLCQIGEAVCRKVHQALQEQSIEERSSVHQEGADDTIYQIDKDVEDIIVPLLRKQATALGGVVLIAEGIGEGSLDGLVLPENIEAAEAAVRIIMDPIDGTRGIMYDKRSAFFLAGAAPNKGRQTRLQDIEVAVMTELPTSRSVLSDTLWAIKGKGTHRYTWHLEKNTRETRIIRPSQSPTWYGGFGQIARFFPPGRETLAAIEDDMLATLFPDAPAGKAIVFEDQYISSGGQLYEILVGHDRFVADIRESLFRKMKQAGQKTGHVCHPYDVCASLIGTEAGIIITGPGGEPLDAPLDTTSPVDWVAYANEQLRAQIEPVLRASMVKYGLS